MVPRRMMLGVLVLVTALPAAALDRIRAERVVAAGVTASAVTVRLDAGNLDLRAQRIDVGEAIESPQEARWSCALEAKESGWRCEGAASALFARERSRGTLAIERDAGGTKVALSKGGAKLDVGLPDDGPANVAFRRVPLAWAQPWSARALPGIAIGAGRVDGALVLDAPEVPAGHGELDFAGVSFDSTDGEIAAADLSMQVKLRFVGTGAGARTASIEATLQRGAWLVAPVYVEIGDAPIVLSIELAERSDGWDVPRWRWQDEGSLAANGSAQLGADGRLQRIELAAFEARLERAYPRYLQAMLAGTALDELEAQGGVRGRVLYTPDAPINGRLEFDDVTAHDAKGRFTIDGLSGAVPFAPVQPETTGLRWRAAGVHDIAIAGGSLQLRADREGHALAAPLSLTLLEGRVDITRFERTSQRMVGALALEGLSMAALTRALGWPEFGGRLSGRIPAVRSEGDRIEFDGGLSFDVFDGRVEAKSMALERAFGVAPSLAADLTLSDLDLAQLTSTFSFGTIEGRLDGRFEGLRLVDWKPVAFDLELRTDDAYRGKKRISQRAVNSLSAVGGAGAAAGIQTTVLKVFDTFSYGAIGLTCRLANNVCEMGGLDSENGGYTIVRGAGLPRLTVVGHQRRVDWPVLVARLEAATEGAGPVVQ